MSDQPDRQPSSKSASSWSGRLALVIALLALAATAAQWLGLASNKALERSRSEEIAKNQRRINALEDRVQRERDDFNRLVARIGTEGQPDDPLTARVARLEDSLARMPGGERVRFTWLLEQAEYFLRMANAQESLAGDSASALTALSIADELLGIAADPRLTSLRKIIAGEIAALRAVPRVDTEGLALKLGTLAGSLGQLPRRLTAQPAFNPEPATVPAGASGFDRALEALRNAFLSIVSIRRTGEPSATLMTDESATVLMHSLELELQMARFALLKGESATFKTSLEAARRDIEEYFDTSSPEGAAALATLDDVARASLPQSLPDLSASLAELLKIRERQSGS